MLYLLPPTRRVPYFFTSARQTDDIDIPRRVALPLCSTRRACYVVVLRVRSLFMFLEVDVGCDPCVLLSPITLRCCSSRCLTFLAKHASFLAKSVPFIVKCNCLLNFSLYSCCLNPVFIYRKL